MTTQGEVMQGWKGYGCRIAVIMYKEEIRSKRKHNKLWAQLFINRHKSRINKARRGIISVFDDLNDFTLTREQTSRRARATVICPFAYVLDGQWYERGKMGWWALVQDEQDKKSWTEQFNDMFDSLPKTYWATVVDCHI